MSNFSPDKSQQGALLSWYKEGNELRMNPRHPLIALAGEAGEILDLFKKHNYKPGFNWWYCKNCKRGGGYELRQMVHDGCDNYVPLVLDEMGDFSYYLRILSFQQEISFETLCDAFEPFQDNLDKLLADLAFYSARLLKQWLEVGIIPKMELQVITFVFLSILYQLDTPLEIILDLNYKKLNSEATQHGWSSAR